ncbi:MAG: hypothetical protein HC897_09835 [Thermoanaerobaculia bacterium]|nr:hypothetical protein [Thermoanaerobaculia bacterium]
MSWPLDLAAARLDFARNDLKRAAENLQTPLAEMTTGGFAEYQLETRLLLIEIELKAVGTRGARARLDQLAKEAEQKGFGRLALKARQSLIDIPQN